MGGQTALNTTLDLNRHKILQKYGVKIIGASVNSIDMAEDRELFKKAMEDIGLLTPRAQVAKDFDKLLPNSDLFWIDKCGHAPMMEHPNLFNDILYGWLSRKNL